MGESKRITIVAPIDLYNRVTTLFEWGERNKILLRTLEWLCEKVETHGKDALILLLRDADLDKLLKMREKEISNGNNS